VVAAGDGKCKTKGKCKTSTGQTKGRVLSPSAQRDRGYVTEIKSNRRREVMRSYLQFFYGKKSRGGGKGDSKRCERLEPFLAELVWGVR
jgi:hypothetical protein